MSTISLREYLQNVSILIERNQFDEAIFHCTHILKNYPKCIQAYQHLGRALLENKRYSDASLVFSKILAVFPDDFAAHAGLSEIYEENREIDKAIWHMEQAFETQPSNINIQEELRRLIGRRDGFPPAKLRLTRGALIRMYAKGDLYQQAIAEIQSTLTTDPERTDLKLLLADLLKSTGVSPEAAEICNQILIKNPYCYAANLMMYDLAFTENGNPRSLYFQRLCDLDPYFSFISKPTESVVDVPADEILLDKAEFVPEFAELTQTPDWARQIGINWNIDETQPQVNESEKNDLFSGLFKENDEVGESSPSSPFIDGIEEFSPPLDLVPEPELPVQKNEIPDWISKAGWIRASDEEVPVADKPLDEDQSIAENIEPPSTGALPATPAEDLPDWLRSISPELDKEPEILTPRVNDDASEVEIPPLTPDILNEILSSEDNETEMMLDDNDSTEELIQEPPAPILFESPDQLDSQINEEEAIPELPDWLKDLDTGEEPAVNLPEASLEMQDSQQVSEDFIEELASTDLIDDTEVNTLIDQESRLEYEEVDLSILAELDQIPVEKEQIFEISANDEVVSIEEQSTIQVLPETASVASEQNLEQTETKPAVPTWVQRIISGGSAITTASSADSIKTTARQDEKLAEEAIPELISDLPDVENHLGAITESDTQELETWLEEVSPIEDVEGVEELETVSESVIESEPAMITYDILAGDETVNDIAETDDTQTNIELTEDEFLTAVGLDDRISKMVVEEETVPETSVVDEDVLPPALTSIDSTVSSALKNLLHKGDYETFVQELETESLPEEESADLINEIKLELEANPDSIELWQGIGDLHFRRSSLQDALEAYQEAEKRLFS